MLSRSVDPHNSQITWRVNGIWAKVAKTLDYEANLVLSARNLMIRMVHLYYIKYTSFDLFELDFKLQILLVRYYAFF